MTHPPAQRRAAPASSRRITAHPRWSAEGYFTYCRGVHELRLPEAPRSIGRSWHVAAEFALIEDDPLLLIAYRFGDSSPWFAADYRCASDQFRVGELPPLGGLFEARALVSVMLPGPDLGWMTLGNFTMSLDFTRALNAAIRERASRRFDPSEQARALQAFSARYPSVPGLVARAGVKTCGSP